MTKIEAEGLDKFRRELKRVDSNYGKALRQVHLEIAAMVSAAAGAAAPGSAKRGISPKATQKEAALILKRGRGDALARFLGAKRRTGWYAAQRYAGSPGRQFEPWVGNQYDPGDQAGKPYHIGDAINALIPDEVIDLYEDGIEKLLSRAFPDEGL